MKFIKTEIPDVIIIEPKVFGDDRGYFFESFNQKEFEEHIGVVNFVQDNESKSSRGVLRGLHFQKPPFNQAKLVRCIAGEVLDVAVDIRKNSATYKKYVAVNLSGDNKRQLFIPRGFAHGFLTLSDSAKVFYKCDNYYNKEAEEGIRYDDAVLGINWNLYEDSITASIRDLTLGTFRWVIV